MYVRHESSSCRRGSLANRGDARDSARGIAQLGLEPRRDELAQGRSILRRPTHDGPYGPGKRREILDLFVLVGRLMQEERSVEQGLDGRPRGRPIETGIQRAGGEVGLKDEQDGGDLGGQSRGHPVGEHRVDGGGEGGEHLVKDLVGLDLRDERPWESDDSMVSAWAR